MVTELFTVVALPHSIAADAEFHVSLFVSPQLTPDGAEGRLDDFAYFLKWAALLVKDSVIELSDQAGVIPSSARLDDVDPDDWFDVFPPDTPVRGPQRPDWSNRPWRTFRASEVHDAGKLLHLVAMFPSPTSPPLPSAHPLLRLISQYGGSDRGYDESVITRGFDGILGEFGEGDWLSLESVEETLSAVEPFTRTLLEVHRARRFYERPESAGDYQERPDENAVIEKLPRPEPDFHERASFLADHPALQRRLGLVVDLVVDDLDRLAKSEWLSGRIEVAGDPAPGRSTRTRCRAVGDDLVTIARTADWHDAALRLGDTDMFAVLDMDPDGTALKLDRYLWTLPRLLAVEQNGDPVHAAPSALRSIGFTVARRQKALETKDRMARQHELAAMTASFDLPLLDTEDVTQGMRVEVWDDTAGAWYTLHTRRIDAEALGAGQIVSDLPEEGFVQGTTATETSGVDEGRVHVHEAMFGWDGWSLAAPRPGKRVRHEGGDEIVEDTKPEANPVTPLVVTNEAEPGTLPRLRYGRSYAFRTWAVDLAGNSRPHALGPPPTPDPAEVAAVATMLPTAPAVARSDVIAPLRGAAAAGIVERRQPREPETVDVRDVLEIHGRPDEVLGRLAERRSGATAARPVIDRAAIVDRAFEDVVLADDQPFVVGTAVFDPAVVAGAFGHPGTVILPTPEEVATVSPLRPFLRWDPVQPPAVVARHPITAGESLRQVVVRSGVTQDLATLEITVVPPAEYAAQHAGLGYRRTSERHLVPPKTSQSEAELHGAFDRAIGSTDLDRHKALLAVAVREAGTLFDVDVPRLANPLVRDPQPGISLASEPSVPPSERKTLPLTPGVPPAPGQYVVHDVDDLVVPYLPDVAAAGISLVFPEAGRDRSIPFPFGAEGFTARWRGTWPQRRPYRLQLRGAAQLQGRLVGTELRIGLPPGDVQRFRLASSIDPADLDLFGLWRILPEVLRTNPDIVEAAADGWIWAFTPFDEVTLVHAVPRPLEAPRPTTIVPARAGEGATDVTMFGAVDVHGPSTEQLTAEARWVDPVDDLSLPGPEDQDHQAVAFTTVIREDEDLSVLAAVPVDVRVPVPGFGPVWVHRAVHQLGDTRHHTISYRFRASTRFREYFDAEVLAPPPQVPGLPVDDGQSVVGPEVTLSIKSSAKPAAPIVHSVIPLFRWDEGTEPEQPVALRRRRRAGVRIYLERPWYSSGEGELLAVLLAPGANDAALGTLVSQWGTDPVWVARPIPNRALFLEMDSLLRAIGLDDRPGDALPVVAPVNLPLATQPGAPMVTVLGYQPQYNAERGLWYVDVAIDPGSRMWPFVRLSIARYQPDSIAGCHLSAPVLCDFVQLTPERTASVSRTDTRHVRVVVSGPVGVRNPPSDPQVEVGTFPLSPVELAKWVRVNRMMVARLQRRDPDIPTDLGWETVDVVELDVRGTGRDAVTGVVDPFQAAWVGSLTAPRNLSLRRPGFLPNWRVTIEEWERLPGDPADLGFVGAAAPPPVWEHRLVYADEIGL